MKHSDAFTEKQLKNTSGVTDSIEEFSDAYNNIVDRFSKDPGFSHSDILNKIVTSYKDSSNTKLIIPIEGQKELVFINDIQHVSLCHIVDLCS